MALPIQDLLNPVPEVTSNSISESTCNRHRTSSSPAIPASSLGREKRISMPKDAAIFRKGSPQGEVRYPPHEAVDPQLASIHREFKLHPSGSIAEYPRHIPYQSDKKSFQEKTGRDSFHGKALPSLFLLRSSTDLYNSLPVHIPSPRRRSSLDCDVGLQYRTRAHDSSFQMHEPFQGMSPYSRIQQATSNTFPRLHQAES